MRKQLRRVCCGVLVVLLAMSVVGCSSVLERVKGSDKPKTEPTKTEPTKTEPTKTKPTKTKPTKPDVESMIQQGLAHRENGRLQKAIASFKQALEIEPKNAKASQYLQETQQELDALVEEYLRQGIKYFTQDALQEAMDEWNKVLALDPSNQKALDYKGRTQRKLDALK